MQDVSRPHLVEDEGRGLTGNVDIVRSAKDGTRASKRTDRETIPPSQDLAVDQRRSPRAADAQHGVPRGVQQLMHALVVEAHAHRDLGRLPRQM